MMTWVTLTRRTNDPKLKVIEACLDELGISYRRRGESFHAPILEVMEKNADSAQRLLNAPLGGPSVGLVLTLTPKALLDLQRRNGWPCTLDNVPDDDPVFQEWVDVHGGSSWLLG